VNGRVVGDDDAPIILDGDGVLELLEVLAGVADRLDTQDELRARQSKPRVNGAYRKPTSPHSGPIGQAS
jgi:hypothetical protein